MRSTLILLALFASSAVSALSARGEDLLVNGSFEGGLAGWYRNGNVRWSAAWGGAARVDEPTSAGSEALFQCVAVEGDALYALSAAATLPVHPEATGALSVRVRWHDAPGCGERVIGGSTALEFGPSAEVRQEKSRVVVSPAGARSALVLLVSRADAVDTYTFAVDRVSFGGGIPGEVLTVPSAASAPAPDGQRWETDLWVRNRAPRDRWFTMKLRCPLPCGQNPEPLAFRLGPNEARAFPRVVSDALGAGQRTRAGAIEIAYDPRDGGLDAFARAATANGDRPGNGTPIPALPSSARTTAATFVGLSGLGGGAGARVNAGAYNPNDAGVVVAYSVLDASGDLVGYLERPFAPHEWFQVNDLLAATGAPAGAASSILVEAGRPVFPFAIAVDNRSSDPTWLAPLTGAPE